jgi:hypothetical protein
MIWTSKKKQDKTKKTIKTGKKNQTIMQRKFKVNGNVI